MAKAVVRQPQPEVVLTLSKEEALYTLAAVSYCDPVKYESLGGDPVYFALYDALVDDLGAFVKEDFAELRPRP